MVKWKVEQKDAFTDRGNNLLVSASAGSGKTTVMIERIFRLITEDRVPVTDFLVVTFTKNSAQDMKKKLIKKLSENLSDEFVQEQIENMAVSDISNLHSFCSRLISTYFYEVGVDPNYHIIDDGESQILKNRALSSLFEKKQNDGDVDFFELFDIFQKKRNDSKLKEIIMHFNDVLNSHLDGKAWFEKNLELSHTTNLRANRCANIISSYVSNAIAEDIKNADDFAFECYASGERKLGMHFDDIVSKLKTINKRNGFVLNSKNLEDISFDRTPRVCDEKNKFLSEKASIIKDEIKENINNYKNNFVSSDESLLIQGITKSKETLKKLYNLTEEFCAIYQKLKADSNGLDFCDLERYALKILDNTAIRQSVRQKYKYVFVDEYQDINDVQEKIISLVSSETNRFMVGDVKQSIYRFRLCDSEIFLKKYYQYKTGRLHSRLIKLNYNFRSDKNILRFVDKVFSDVMTEDFGGLDYKNESKFIAGDENRNVAGSVELLYIDSTKEKLEKQVASGVYSVKNHVQGNLEEDEKAVAEAVVVANKIKDLVNPLNDNPIDFKDIAILVASKNATISKFTDTLRAFGIDVVSDEKKNVASEFYIQEIVQMLKLACNDKDDFVLAKVLKSRLFNFTNSELAEIRKLDYSCRFFECLDKFIDLKDSNLKTKVENFIRQKNTYMALAKLLPVKEFALKIISDFDLEKQNLLEIDGVQYNEVMSDFVNMLPSTGIKEYVLEYASQPLEIESSGAGNAVQLMTIHKSKGMEFKAVFLVNTSNNFNFQSCYGNILLNKKLGAGMDYFDRLARSQYSTIPISAIRLTEKRKLVEEQQRVLYVGLTRAIEKMFIVCTKDISSISDTFPNRPKAFINWFEPMIYKSLTQGKQRGYVFEKYKLNELRFSEKTDCKQIALTKSSVNKTWFEYDFSGRENIPEKTSVTKLVEGEEFAEEEGEENEESIAIKSCSDRGTACHKVLQFIDFSSKEDFPLQIEKIASEKLTQRESKFVDVETILKILDEPFFAQISKNDIVLKEREFFAKVKASELSEKFKFDDDVLIQGVIDLVVIKENEILVADYKTGSLNQEKLKKYSKQLNIYSSVIEKVFGKKITGKFLIMLDLQKILQI